MSISISILIATNRVDDIENRAGHTVGSLQGCPHPYEVIIVSPEPVELPNCRHVKDMGTGSIDAFNLAVPHAKNQYILVLSDDVVVRGDWWRMVEQVHANQCAIGTLKANPIGKAISPHLPIISKTMLHGVFNNHIFNPAYFHRWADNDLGLMCYCFDIPVLVPEDYRASGNGRYWEATCKGSNEFRTHEDVDAQIFKDLWEQNNEIHELSLSDRSEEIKKIAQERIKIPECYCRIHRARTYYQNALRSKKWIKSPS
jgi:hypothetical protein